MKAKKLATLPTLARYLSVGISASDWYAKANESIQAYADRMGLPVGLVADVLALVSPRKTVAESVRIAKVYLDTGELTEVTQPVRTQFAYWLETGIIRGPKCSAFARALLGDGDALVVDTWIMQALNAPISSTGKKWVLEAAERRFKRLADITGLQIVEAQAAVWCGVQGGHCDYLEIN